MNSLSKHFSLVLFIFFGLPGFAQQMVQTPNDVFVVCVKDNEFIGKPLKDLLKEIKPPIKMVFAEGGWTEVAPQFSFFFMSVSGFDSCRIRGKLPLRLHVYVNKFYQWNRRQKQGQRTYFRMDERG